MKQAIAVGLSGGVDSAVTAYLLQQAGWQVEGVFMKNWDEDDDSEDCTFKEDFAMAERVAEHLRIPLHLKSLSVDYYSQVFQPMLEQYSQGRTPNPDVLCNRHIKFSAFPELLMDMGFTWFATGHYAHSNVQPNYKETWQPKMTPNINLSLAKDSKKDQTYFLSGAKNDGLTRCLFPLGDFTRAKVRELAAGIALPNATRPGSTGVCFISPTRFQTFLSHYLPAKPGDVVDKAGRVLGQHRGAHLYTVGQRRGLGIGGIKGAPGDPWYVGATDVASNKILAVHGHDEDLDSAWVQLAEPNWIGALGEQDIQAGLAGKWLARFLHGGALVPCTLEEFVPLSPLVLRLREPAHALAVGQQCALYAGKRCLGGGAMLRTEAGEKLQAFLQG